MAEVEIQTERVDDVPLLMEQQRKMGIPEILDKVIQPHGNRQGLSVGWLTTTWLSYILSQADHRLSEVETWAKGQIETLSALLPEPVHR
jgi:transposase